MPEGHRATIAGITMILAHGTSCQDEGMMWGPLDGGTRPSLQRFQHKMSNHLSQSRFLYGNQPLSYSGRPFSGLLCIEREALQWATASGRPFSGLLRIEREALQWATASGKPFSGLLRWGVDARRT